MKSRSLTLIAAVLVVGAAVFFIGRYSAPSGAEGSKSSTDKPLADASAVRHAGDAGGEGLSQRRTTSSAERRKSAPTGAEAFARMQAILRNEDAMARNRDFLKYVSQLGPDDFEAVEAYFRSMGMIDTREGEYAVLLNAWAQADPVKALDYLLAKDGSNPDATSISTVLGAWAAKDADAAIAWATAKHPGTDPNPFMADIIPAIAASDITRATALLTAMPNSPERDKAHGGVLNQILRYNLDGARQWLESLTDTSLRDDSLPMIATHSSSADPAGAAKWLLNYSGEAANTSMSAVLYSWATKDPASASSFFATLPSGDARACAFSGLVSGIAAKSPQDGAALLEKYPADASGGAICDFVRCSLDENPELALSYVSRIPEDQQEFYYDKALQNWMDQNPTKAKAWQQTHPAPQSVPQDPQGQEAP